MNTTLITEPDVRDVYDAFACFYDRLTASSNYDLVMGMIDDLVRAHGVDGGRLLDVACGTGKSMEPMIARGWDVDGCDISPAMLAEARAKLGPGIDLRELDMRELPPLGPYDLVTCIDEPLNYLYTADELAAAFRSAARCLRPGGLYVFDLNTAFCYRTAFSSEERQEVDGWTIVWRGRTDPGFAAGGIAEMVTEGHEPAADGGIVRHVAHHAQRHHPPALVKSLLQSAGFEVVAARGQHWDGSQDDFLDDDAHFKAMYIARRRA